MSAPYWGKLPPPAVVRHPSTRREEGNHPKLTVNTQTDPYMDPSAASSQSRQNRHSTQTAATTSTQSPFVSPLASSFEPEGLAPRPGSYKYGAQYPSVQLDANKDYLEKRRRRETRNRDQFYEDTAARPPPPPAPDAPRPPPPVSYKQSSGEIPVRSNSNRHRATPSDYHEDDYHVDGRAYNDIDPKSSRANGKTISRSGTVDSRRDRSGYSSSQPRRVSASEAEERRRREWAAERSPLQRLESTLDSITKEEKRARVEEAELRAREAQATGRGDARTNENSVRFRNRPVAVKPSEEIASSSIDTAQDIDPAHTEKLQRSRTVQRSNFDATAVTSTKGSKPIERRPQQATIDNNSRPDKEIPQRGASVRDKAGVPVAAALAGAGAVAGASLSRSRSNKLKKEPPGDPWYQRRKEGEQKYNQVVPKRAFVDDSADTRRGIPQNSAHMQEESVVRRPIDQYDSDPEFMDTAVPVRRGSIKKIEQLTGHKASDPRSTSAMQQKPNGVARSTGNGSIRVIDRETQPNAHLVNWTKYSEPPAVAGPNKHNDAPHHKQDRHHFTNLLHHRHNEVPGGGVYVPQPRLNEWKKGGTALLAGELLDLNITNEKNEAEKDKAWWEAGHTGKRRASTSKQHSAEAFDGGYDDSNGKGTSHVSNNECGPCILENDLEWTSSEVLVTPRARRYFGYLGDSSKEKKRQRSNKSWLISPGSHPATTEHKSASKLFSLFSFNPLFQRQAIIDKSSFILFKSSTRKEHSLTCTTRPIRARSVIAPTRFKPHLFLKSGPFLRYCGMRRERLQNPPGRLPAAAMEREIWRGSVMIVTADEHSSYEFAPVLRLFSQPMELLPPPPAQVDGSLGNLPQEYIDPLAGLPKLGRDGRTLYIRPVEHLEEEKDLSKLESDDGLFEMRRSNLDGTTDKNPRPKQRPRIDGEKLGKYKEVKGIRLHAERGVTFWRFNIEIELKSTQQRIAYRINRGPATGFWVPGRDQAMNIMFHSCNGFSLSVNPDQFSGPDPMWRDVLNTHQTRPFHVMLGGGDQIYNDAVMDGSTLFEEWLRIKNPIHKENEPFTPELQDELESFYLQRYCMWFSQGLFGVANSQIPMINIYDDHDIIDGFGSYPDHYMRCPIMSGLGSVAFKYYMLFQHQSSIDEGEDTEPSWILGTRPGPYIPELSRSVFTNLGRSIAFLGLDCRTERMHNEVVSAESYDKIFNRLEREIIKGVTRHLIVLLGVPIAYPRMVWLENILTSRMFEPVKALSRAGILKKGLLNTFDGGVEVLDDLDDHWTAKNHKKERNWFIQELQELAADKSVRITILGGDVHLAAIGQFYSNPKLKIPKDQDHRYMPNIISSAIVNTPPPDMLADVLNKRNKVHHLDHETDEDMIPIFTHDVTGKSRNNKRLLNRRNWCSIRQYDPELTPPPTPGTPSEERSPSPPPTRGILRRFSTSKGPSYRPDAAAPPLSSAGGFFNRRPSFSSRRSSIDSQRPGSLTRTLSLTRRDFMPGNLFRKKRRPDDGGINGYGAESDSDISPPERSGLRGGSGGPVGGPTDEDYFSRSRGKEIGNPVDQATTSVAGGTPHAGGLVRSQFHRTPTGLSGKQKKNAADGRHDVNLEGGLDICLNMEISQKDPAGITMPYRLLVPRLWYEAEDESESESESGSESGSSRSGGGSSYSGHSGQGRRRGSGLSRLMSFKRR
ncbi:hypothetical protein BP5796_06784 [Coleophoma crateriformis]|uniref:PhoD-like phosphatase domain-containing protein n=1 Tax=Coleophoma crateriformis TaxID=565419 RepID=A0A3D8RPH7_9HELO|nr:hypothetical protein BP5796_06784 [Coleophoma crateriformis]